MVMRYQPPGEGQPEPLPITLAIALATGTHPPLVESHSEEMVSVKVSQLRKSNEETDRLWGIIKKVRAAYRAERRRADASSRKLAVATAMVHELREVLESVEAAGDALDAIIDEYGEELND